MMNDRDRELLTGMGNCYEACHEDFESTVGMVSSSRRRTSDEVKQTLARLRMEFGRDPEYQALRGRLPAEFPF